MKTSVVFQGGEPLGAFGAGARAALGPWLRAEEHELVGIARRIDITREPQANDGISGQFD
ncbi:MAG TPA: hypothetical protein VIN58_09845 [Roseateles sp.]